MRTTDENRQFYVCLIMISSVVSVFGRANRTGVIKNEHRQQFCKILYNEEIIRSVDRNEPDVKRFKPCSLFENLIIFQCLVKTCQSIPPGHEVRGVALNFPCGMTVTFIRPILVS